MHWIWFSSKTRSLLSFLFTWTPLYTGLFSSDLFWHSWLWTDSHNVHHVSNISDTLGTKKDQNVGFWDLLPHCLSLGVPSGSSSKHRSTPLFIDLSTTFDLNRTEYSSYSKTPKTAVCHLVKRKCPIHNIFTGDVAQDKAVRQSHFLHGWKDFCIPKPTATFQHLVRRPDMCNW